MYTCIFSMISRINTFQFLLYSRTTSKQRSWPSRKATERPINTQAHHNTILHNTHHLSNTPGQAMGIIVPIATANMVVIVTANMAVIATANMVVIVMAMGRSRSASMAPCRMEQLTATIQIMIMYRQGQPSLMVSHKI